MAGKVLTEEDFKEGNKPEEKDTSKPIPADQKIEIKGKEEPEEKVEPSKKVEEEPQPEPSEEKPKFKHATWEETEKARIEAEKKMHEATTEKSKLERELSQYKKPPEKPTTLEDKIKEMTKDTVGKIRLIPQDSATRDEDAAFLWATLQSNISDLKYEERSNAERTQKNVVQRTYEKATKEGIKTDAELRILGYEFSKTDPSLSTDERITQAIDSTKETLSQIREGLVEKQERDKKEKEDLKVLGRGSSRTVKSDEKDKEKEKGGSSMSEALSQINQSRRLKKDDLY